jgi:serine/threonine protein phosphatase 1
VRIYAIGDVHGRADLLHAAFGRIDADLAANPISQPIEIYLGDYIDRGPHSRSVVDLLLDRSRRRDTIFLKGNHETYVLEFLNNPSILDAWRNFGGLETLMSYGLSPSLNPSRTEEIKLAAAFQNVFPDDHYQFYQSLPHFFSYGDYFFVHAGVRPGVPLDQQEERDLLWIREEFLFHEESFGKIVVHGHTPVKEPDLRSNRINIDTGAYATGRLTCLAIEGEATAFI